MLKGINVNELANRAACLTAGTVAGGLLDKHIPANINPYLKSFLIIGVGAAVGAKAKEKTFMKAMADGLIGYGASRIVKIVAPNMISGGIAGAEEGLDGIGYIPMTEMIAGDDEPVIVAGTRAPGVTNLSGIGANVD